MRAVGGRLEAHGRVTGPGNTVLVVDLKVEKRFCAREKLSHAFLAWTFCIGHGRGGGWTKRGVWTRLDDIIAHTRPLVRELNTGPGQDASLEPNRCKDEPQNRV